MSSWLGRFYEWFWFHTEFWLTPTNRRPYTFIMRDWIYRHLNAFTAMVFVFIAGMIALSFQQGTKATLLSLFGGLLIAHLVWGSKWIENQQEFPEYLGEENNGR
jgi:hypothetical protein